MDVTVNFKGGGSLVNYQPVFSSDKEQIFVCWRNSILSYGTQTGKLLHEYKGLSENIIGFGVVKYNSYDCICACSSSGEIIVWKIVTNFKVFQKQLPSGDKNVKTFHLLSLEDDTEISAIISYETRKSIKFAFCNYDKDIFQDYKLTLERLEYHLHVGDSSEYFTIVQETSIFFLRTKDYKHNNKQNIGSNRRFTCVACHPTEEIVLTGDDSGRIVVWQAIFSKKCTQAVFHWHTLPVNCVSFSKSGSYFYSGADECVLVKWELDNPVQKNFLPRLPASIRQISVSEENTYIACATSDNAVHIYNSLFKLQALVQHLVLGDQFETGIVYDPKTKALIMNGHVGHVQFYVPQDMTLLYNLDIVGRNRITNERDCVMKNTDITKLAISKSGDWLATVEERKDFTYQYEIRLKFWMFNSTSQTFELNTSIEYPHESSINSIRFQPLVHDTNLKCVTVGDDKQYKIWQIIETETPYKKGYAWKCISSVSYRGFSCSGLAYSMDGSLVAVGFGEIVTAWSPETCELKCSLKHSINKGEIKFIEFGNENQCHLLVSASNEQMSVWNLLNLSMTWTVSIRVSLLVADPLSTYIAVFTSDKKMYLFSPESKETLFTSDKLLKNYKDIVAATFVPTRNCNDHSLNWYERSQLYFIDTRRELYCIGDNNDNEESLYTYIDESKLTPFALSIPDIKKSNVKSVLPSKHLYEKDIAHKTLKNVFGGPVADHDPNSFLLWFNFKFYGFTKRETVSLVFSFYKILNYDD